MMYRGYLPLVDTLCMSTTKNSGHFDDIRDLHDAATHQHLNTVCGFDMCCIYIMTHKNGQLNNNNVYDMYVVPIGNIMEEYSGIFWFECASCCQQLCTCMCSQTFLQQNPFVL